MFSKKPNESPYGVPLWQIEKALESTSLTVSRKDNRLVVKHEVLTTILDVLRPTNTETDSEKIAAVVTIKTALSQQMNSFLNKPEMCGLFNSLSTLGSLCEGQEGLFIGSRLTIFEGEDAWNVQFPLLLFTIIGCADQMIGAMKRVFGGEEPKADISKWVQDDFRSVENRLSRFCVCNSGGLGFTAEFGLKPGESSAIAGHQNTALWQLKADQPHPEAGGGLFCLLQLPHCFEDQEALASAANYLNAVEMMPHDLPPHFGAWCPSNTGNTLAYCSFLPNVFYSVSGIATNMSIWAMHRAQIADAMLAIRR
jgi:hypothetical protein